MDKPKEIQLINKLPTSEEVAEIELALEDGDSVLIIPPKRKTVKLSELPDGTIVEHYTGANGFVAFNKIWCYLEPYGNYSREWSHYDGIIKIIESPKQVLEGGECPVPDGVVIRAWYLRDNEIQNTEGWLNLAEFFKNYRVLWFQIRRLADGWELVK